MSNTSNAKSSSDKSAKTKEEREETRSVRSQMAMLRHSDFTKAQAKHGQSQVQGFVRKSESMITRTMRNFWGSHDHHVNRRLFRKVSFDLDDLINFGRVWAGGFLAYEEKIGEPDGRLHNYLRQRTMEVIQWAKKRAADCTPEPTALQREDLEEASISQGTRQDRSKVVRRRVRKLLRIQLLEKLAAHTDENALALLAAEEETSDSRSQGGRLLQEIGSCLGSGQCPLCEVRQRQADYAKVAPPNQATLDGVRLFVEWYLRVSNDFISRNTGKSAESADRFRQQHQHGARLLGLLGMNSDGSLSATKYAYELLALERESKEERAFFWKLINESPTTAPLLPYVENQNTRRGPIWWRWTAHLALALKIRNRGYLRQYSDATVERRLRCLKAWVDYCHERGGRKRAIPERPELDIRWRPEQTSGPAAALRAPAASAADFMRSSTVEKTFAQSRDVIVLGSLISASAKQPFEKMLASNNNLAACIKRIPEGQSGRAEQPIKLRGRKPATEPKRAEPA